VYGLFSICLLWVVIRATVTRLVFMIKTIFSLGLE
jgi:hypothetical protein